MSIVNDYKSALAINFYKKQLPVGENFNNTLIRFVRNIFNGELNLTQNEILEESDEKYKFIDTDNSLTYKFTKLYGIDNLLGIVVNKLGSHYKYSEMWSLDDKGVAKVVDFYYKDNQVFIKFQPLREEYEIKILGKSYSETLSEIDRNNIHNIILSPVSREFKVRQILLFMQKYADFKINGVYMLFDSDTRIRNDYLLDIDRAENEAEETKGKKVSDLADIYMDITGEQYNRDIIVNNFKNIVSNLDIDFDLDVIKIYYDTDFNLVRLNSRKGNQLIIKIIESEDPTYLYTLEMGIGESIGLDMRVLICEDGYKIVKLTYLDPTLHFSYSYNFYTNGERLNKNPYAHYPFMLTISSYGDYNFLNIGKEVETLSLKELLNSFSDRYSSKIYSEFADFFSREFIPIIESYKIDRNKQELYW